MGLRHRAGLGMLGLGIGYFLSFTPYSGLAKAMSSGLLPGMHRPVSGPELLPASALGLLGGMVLFLSITGWWRQARGRQVGRLRIPVPGRETARSALFMSLIVGTTTLNFSFVGVSILFVLVLERLETIVLAPSIDLIRRRRIRTHSWVALGLCALAAAVTLADVRNYRLTLFAALSIVTYLAGYTGRFDVMSRHAKTGTPADRRYFVEEHIATPIILLLILGAFALIGQGTAMRSLRYGFTTFLTTPVALYAVLIGLCYEALFIFTTHIFLDRREFAFGMPVHVCASLLAGIASSLVLQAVYHTAPTSAAQFGAAGCVGAAALVLSYPTLVSILRPATGRMLLFVCGANTCRSAMAEAIARVELATRGLTSWRVESAGLNATPGAAMTTETAAVLHDIGVPTRPHRARQLTPRILSRATVVYCMTAAQRDSVQALRPPASTRVMCLDDTQDLPDPHGQPASVYRDTAAHIHSHVVRRIAEFAASAGTAAPHRAESRA